MNLKEEHQSIKKLTHKDMILDLSEANNTVLLKTGEIICIKKMSVSEKSVSFEGFKYLKLEDLIDYPCNLKMSESIN